MSQKTEIILINISGGDKPGVTSALTRILARYNATILDIGQADIHHTFSLEAYPTVIFTFTNRRKFDIYFQFISLE